MKYRKLVALSLMSILALSGCGSSEEAAPGGAGGPGMGMQSSTAVEVESAAIDTIETYFVYSGTVKASSEANVYSTVSGIVDYVNYEVGDEVKAGDTLFKMDTESLEIALTSANASVATSGVSVSVAENNLATVNGSSMQTQINSAQLSAENLKVAYDQAVRNYENGVILNEQGFLSSVDLQSLQEAYLTAEISYNNAVTYYETLQTTTLEENITSAQLSVESAQAQLNAAQSQVTSAAKSLRDATVTSPMDGTVTSVGVTAGVMSTSTSPHFTISDLSSLVVEISVSEQLVNYITKGDEVEVTINTLSSEPFVGTIKTVNPSANAGGTYDVEVEVENEDGLMKSGMFAEVKFSKAKGDDAIVVDIDIVMDEDDVEYVYVDVDGVATRKDVVTGLDNGEYIQILEGISVGELLVTKGQTYISDGSLLNVVAIDGVSTVTTSTSSTGNAPEGGAPEGAPEGGAPEGAPEAKGE